MTVLSNLSLIRAAKNSNISVSLASLLVNRNDEIKISIKFPRLCKYCSTPALVQQSLISKIISRLNGEIPLRNVNEKYTVNPRV